MQPMSHLNKMFMEYYGEEHKPKQAMSQEKVANYDADKRQAPLKSFKKAGRDDYSFTKQLERLNEFEIKGEKRRELIERIDESNNANGFDPIQHR